MTRRRPRASVKPVAATRPPFPAAGIPLLGQVSDRDIAARLGITARAVQAERQARGIAPVRAGRKAPAGGPRRGYTIWMTPAERAAQETAAERAGAASWGEWLREIGNASTTT